MSSEQDGRVRERAYHLWREGGSQHGREMDHWLQAEREMAKPGKPTAKAQSAKTSPAKSATGKSAPAKTQPTKSAPAKGEAAKAPSSKAAPPRAAPTAAKAKPGTPKASKAGKTRA